MLKKTNVTGKELRKFSIGAAAGTVITPDQGYMIISPDSLGYRSVVEGQVSREEAGEWIRNVRKETYENILWPEPLVRAEGPYRHYIYPVEKFSILFGSGYSSFFLVFSWNPKTNLYDLFSEDKYMEEDQESFFYSNFFLAMSKGTDYKPISPEGSEPISELKGKAECIQMRFRTQRGVYEIWSGNRVSGQVQLLIKSPYEWEIFGMMYKLKKERPEWTWNRF